MHFADFTLDQWLTRWTTAEPRIEYDLASSTGPSWTVQELLALDGEDATRRLLALPLKYSHTLGGEAIRDAIAEFTGVPAEAVQVLTGASEAIMLVFMEAAAPGANVIVPAPAFQSFYEMPRTLGLEVRHYQLSREQGYALDVERIAALTDARTRLILVNSPHNPTGAVATPGDLVALHAVAQRCGATLVIDEVYYPSTIARHSAAESVDAVVIGGLSKALCLPGLRLGWILDRDRVRRAQRKEARSYSSISNSSLTELLAEIGLRHRHAPLERARARVQANLACLSAFIDTHRDTLAWVSPQDGLICFPWFVDRPDSRALCERLAGRGVLWVPGDCFGRPEHVRIGVGAAEPSAFARALEIASDTL